MADTKSLEELVDIIAKDKKALVELLRTEYDDGYNDAVSSFHSPISDDQYTRDIVGDEYTIHIGPGGRTATIDGVDGVFRFC